MGKDNFKIELVPVLLNQRTEALITGKVDVLFSLLSYTMDRDLFIPEYGVGLTFSSTPYYYLTSHFVGKAKYVACAENGLVREHECEAMKICVPNGTRYWDEISLKLPKHHITVVSELADSFGAFSNGECNVVIGSWFEVNILKRLPFPPGEDGEVDFVVGDSMFTLEPLAAATRDNDPQWSDFVNWVIQALLAAEQHNITKLNIHDSSVPHFLPTNVFGGQQPNLFEHAVSIGSYGEVYNLFPEEVMPRTRVNAINNATTGLIYSVPFGRTNIDGPGPKAGGTLADVVQRGKLRCGIRSQNRPGFAEEISNATYFASWKGMDVDYCRAIAAAILARASETETIDLVEVLDDEGFQLLQTGDIDVLAGVMDTLERDVQEPKTGTGFSFTRPYFYNNSAALRKIPTDANLCLATREDDPQWSSLVFWIVEATFYAEENKITDLSSNEMPTVKLFGPGFERLFRDAIFAVGNYEDIYQRNLPVPRSGQNMLFDRNNPGPLHYPLPGLFE